MQQVADFVQHQVAVVSIFQLQQEAEHAVAGHARDEVASSLRTHRTQLNKSHSTTHDVQNVHVHVHFKPLETPV